MKCYILESGKDFNLNACTIEEVSSDVQTEIEQACSNWQAKNISQKNGGSLYADDITSDTDYEHLNPEAFVITDGKIAGYYADHFNVCGFIRFNESKKIYVGDYDLSDYSGGSGKIDRGFVYIVRRPDIDDNPYSDIPRFHSQEEYDDYIKWKD